MNSSKKPPLSLRAYARRRGVSDEAVRKAIQSNRLEKSIVVVNGKPKVGDPELADKEWSERTRKLATTAPLSPPDVNTPDDTPDDQISLAEARRRHEIERWLRTRAEREEKELEVAVRRGELVEVEEARATVIDRFVSVRTKLLGLATRIAQRLPGITQEQATEIDDLVREALEELADGQ